MVTGIEKFPKRQVEGVTIIDETLLIPFKAIQNLGDRGQRFVVSYRWLKWVHCAIGPTITTGFFKKLPVDELFLAVIGFAA